MIFNQQEFDEEENETVLDLLLRQGIDVSYSCRIGHCQSCLLQSDNCSPDKSSQRGLKDIALEQQQFLACMQTASSIVAAKFIDKQDLFSSAKLIEKYHFTANICRLTLLPVNPLFYHAGQFVNLRNAKGVVRSYSIASVPFQDKYIELHIARTVDGKMSNWLIDDFEVNDHIELQGPIGECFYSGDEEEHAMILIGNGTGAAPLFGIAKDAINSEHQGELHFYHGAKNKKELYLHQELSALEYNVENFFYHPCITDTSENGDFYFGPTLNEGRCNDIALKELVNSSKCLIYICGNPQMVASTKKQALLKGVSLNNIFTDPFDYLDLRKKPR